MALQQSRHIAGISHDQLAKLVAAVSVPMVVGWVCLFPLVPLVTSIAVFTRGIAAYSAADKLDSAVSSSAAYLKECDAGTSSTAIPAIPLSDPRSSTPRFPCPHHHLTILRIFLAVQS